MKTLSCAAFAFVALVGPVCAASSKEAHPKALDLASVNAAGRPEKEGRDISPGLIKAQVLLDRARISPGVIDGHDGENVRNAFKAFEKTRHIPVDGKLDEELWAKLNEVSSEPVLVEYTISPEDVKGPFVEAMPKKFEDLASLDRLSYTGPEELLAEKFHMDRDLLKALNPGKDFDKAGTSILVANVAAGEKPEHHAEKVAKLEVVKGEHVLRVLAEDGSTIAVYPASIGSEEKPAPSGAHTVRAVAMNPTYTYNPDYAFKGVKAKEKFVIKPGPNNPVGTVWIDLSVESFGIHGTPDPDRVGKAYSQGCVRLTNWDVEDLAKMVRKGMPVVFLD